MTEVIKPYEILSVREDQGGKTVFFRVGRRTMEGPKICVKTMESAIFVSENEDIDTELYKSLRAAGWCG